MIRITRLFLSRIWTHFVDFIDRAPISAEEKNRLQQYTVFIVLGIPTMIIYGVVNLNSGQYPLSAAIFTSCVGLCIGWYLLHRLRNGWFIYRINAMLFGFLVLYMVAIGGEGGSKILWMYTFPMIAFFLLGKREGLMWATGLFVLVAAVFWLPLPQLDRYPYPAAFISRFVITYAMVAVIAYWFEYFRDRYRLRMEAEHLELETERRRLKQEVQKRREAESRTRELNQKLNIVINAIPDVISFKDRKGRNILVNKAFESLAGQPVAEIIGKTDGEIFPAALASLRENSDEQALAYGGPVRSEEICPVSEASEIVFDTIKLPLFDSGGDVIGMLGVSRDITDIRKAEHQLRINEQRFQEILQHSRDILYRRDLKTGAYDYISSAFGTLLGYKPGEIQELVYRGVERMIFEDDRERHGAFIEKLLKAQPGCVAEDTIEYRMRNKNGDLNWFSDRLAVIRDDQGRATFVLGNNREITAQKQADLAVRQANNRLLTILDSIDAHVYVSDLGTYEILFMNRKMKQAFGNPEKGKLCWQFFRREEGPCPNCTNTRLFEREGEPAGFIEWEGRNPITGRWYMNYDRAIKWIDDRWVRLQIAVDITRIKTLEQERRETEAKLKHVEKLEAIGTLAGGIAHDFNNLLSVIMGGLSLVAEDLPPLHDAQSTLRQVERASHKAKDLANQLVTFAKGGAPVMAPGDVGRVVRRAAREAAGKGAVHLRFDFPPDLWTVAFDESQIRRAITHIVVNAVESMPGGGTILISGANRRIGVSENDTRLTLPDGAFVALSIQDEGPGISDQILNQIFDPYFSTKEKGSDKGTGLGLAITHSIITRHKGTIAVTPKRPDGGAIFTIYLPACDAAELETTEDSGAKNEMDPCNGAKTRFWDGAPKPC